MCTYVIADLNINFFSHQVTDIIGLSFDRPPMTDWLRREYNDGGSMSYVIKIHTSMYVHSIGKVIFNLWSRCKVSLT